MLFSLTQPDFYKFYLLRDISPLDTDYPIHDLVLHVFDMLSCQHNVLNDMTEQDSTDFVMTWILTVLDGGDDDVTTGTEKKFREYAHLQFIEGRTLILDFIKKGLTLDGKGLFYTVVAASWFLTSIFKMMF
jgi:hypothetical protein